MAITNTLLQNMREQSPNLYKNELRGSQYGALDLFMMETENPNSILSQNVKDSFVNSIDRTFQIPVFDYDGSISIGSTLPATISDAENTTQLITISPTVYSFGFTQVPAVFQNNEVAMEEDFRVKMTKFINKLGTTLDTAAVAALEAAKTQVSPDTLGHTWSSNILTASLANEEVIIGDLNAAMNSMDFYGGLHIVGNTGLQSIIGHLAQKGAQQDTFKQLQYLDKQLHFTNRLSNASSRKATGYCVESGNVGMLHAFEYEALVQRQTFNHKWNQDVLPGLNVPIGTYYYEGVGDNSGIVGSGFDKGTRTWKRYFGFAILIAFVTAYNSDPTTRANPVLKFNVATS